MLEEPIERLTSRVVEAQLEEHRTGVRVLSGQIEPPGVAMPLSADYAEVLVRHLGGMADYLLLDLGVGLDEVNRRILMHCDHVVVAIEPHRVALSLAQPLLKEMVASLNLARHRISVVLVNKAPSAATFTKAEIEDLLQHDLVGVITPAAELAFQATEKGQPMVTMQPNSLVAQQFRNVAEYLAGA